ncbi:MAG: DNA-protecting protein DprA [Spirochaetia bacterium]|nr:DNA-protecting protein DprA [Spirochaetia bacterium]
MLAACLPYRAAFFRAGGWSKQSGSFRGFFSRQELETASRLAKQELMQLELHPEISLIHIQDERYPPLLRAIYDPPPVLFYRGPFPRFEPIAIVGTRNPSALVIAALDLLVPELPWRGVVSGFARGVDIAAHSAALRTSRENSAVLGAGILQAGPSSSLARFKGAENRICLISEFPPSFRAQPGYFPRRNRIIAGMARMVLLFQAPEKSGALITARYALDEGREVLCFDHPILSDQENAGARRLIYEGAPAFGVRGLESRIFRRPERAWTPDEAQMRLWEKKQAGLRWLKDDLFIEEDEKKR